MTTSSSANDNCKSCTSDKAGKNKERETHHRHSNDLPFTTTTSNHNNNKTQTSSQNQNFRDSSIKYLDYENLIKQFEKFKLRAEHYADKDPEFAAKLINFARKLSQTNTSTKMDSAYYTNASSYYPNTAPIYSTHPNIYSSFNSNHFQHHHQHHHNYQKQNATAPPSAAPRAAPTERTKYSDKFKYSQPNYSRYSYDSSSFPHQQQQQARQANNTTPQAGFSQNIYSQYFNYTYPQTDKPYSYSFSYHAQDTRPEDLLLILEDPYDSNKITVQMTRTHLGPNGEQQRVTVERDFKSEAELNKFLKDFEDNLNKNSSSFPTKSSSYSHLFGKRSSLHENDDLIKSPGVVVVEEPGEEPKLYRQDTGELVTNGVFIDPFLKAENNEHPNDLPKEKEKAKYGSTNPSKIYKDIDELVQKLKNEQTASASKNENQTKSNEGKSTEQKENIQNNNSSPANSDKAKIDMRTYETLNNFREARSRISTNKVSSNSQANTNTESKARATRTAKRAESYILPKTSSVCNNKSFPNAKDSIPKPRHRSTSIRSGSRPSKHQSLNEKDMIKKLIGSPERLLPIDKKIQIPKTPVLPKINSKLPSTLPNSPLHTHLPKQTMSHTEKSSSLIKEVIKEKSKIRVINIHKNVTCKRTASLSENLNGVRLPRLLKPDLIKKTDEEVKTTQQKTSFQPNSNHYKQNHERPLVNHAKIGGDGPTLRRHSSLLYPKTHLPRSESNINYEKNKIDIDLSIKNYIETKKKELNVPKTEAKPVTVEKRQPKKAEIKSRFSLRETRPNKPLNNNNTNRRYSQIYEKDQVEISDISTIIEETGKKEEDSSLPGANLKTTNLENKKIKLIKNHRLLMTKKLSKSVDTGLSENQNSQKSKYLNLKNNNEIKKEEKESKDKKVVEGNNVNKNNAKEEYDPEKDFTESEYETGALYFEEEDGQFRQYSPQMYSSSNKHINYDFYSYDPASLYTMDSGQYYGNMYYRTQPSPAYFQPSYFPRSSVKSRLVAPVLDRGSNQNTQQQQQHPQQQHHYQNCHQHHSYRQSGYYASWYGSAPSLRVPPPRQDHFHFN